MEIPVISKRTDSYSIFIEPDFSEFKERFVPLFPDAKKVCIVSDESVYSLYKESVEPVLKESFEVVSFVTVRCGLATYSLTMLLPSTAATSCPSPLSVTTTVTVYGVLS